MKKYYVYELYNTNGEVEYVGASVNPKNRFSYHKSKQGAFTKRTDINYRIIKEFDNTYDTYLFEGELKIKNGFEWTEKIRNSNNAKANGIKQKGIPCAARALKGEKNNKAKLTNKDVLKIIELNQSGNYLQKEIASMFNVHRSAIARIIQGKAWNHLKTSYV
jgi:predicted GIY-YIG superfamily endonuclease